MKDASDYLAYIGSLILINSQVRHWQVVREEQQGESGLFRYRLALQNGDMIEMFERFDIVQQQVVVTKYSYHWQRADGELVRRWDNAAHHPEIPTHPHHFHDGDETNVLPHGPISVANVLALVEQSG